MCELTKKPIIKLNKGIQFGSWFLEVSFFLVSVFPMLDQFGRVPPHPNTKEIKHRTKSNENRNRKGIEYVNQFGSQFPEYPSSVSVFLALGRFGLRTVLILHLETFLWPWL